MKIPHDNFCVLPWISLETSPIGTVRPCCLADHEVVDDEGTKITLGEMALQDIRNTRHMRELRQQFLRAERPETCRRCWAEEDAGRTSKRMHTLDRLKHIVTDDTWAEEAKPLRFLDLKLGNICNLKCRICGSWSSSSYAAEEIKYQKDRKNNFHYVMMKLGQWPREEQRFWQDLERHLSGIRYLEFTGGEPFMIDEHFELLRKLVQNGLADNVEIHYNTNGTIWPSSAENIWKNFKKVEIAFSIDDVAKRFEYQRTNADWNMVCGHLEKFCDMRNRLPNICLQVCCTINIYNILHLDQVAAWIDQQQFDFVYWNMLHDPQHLCIANLPQEIKKHIRDHVSLQKFSASHTKEIELALGFMDQGTPGPIEHLLQHIKSLDRRRDHDLRAVDPDLADLLTYRI